MAALGNVWLRAHTYGPGSPAELTNIPDHDWAAFARALGAQGFTVDDPAQLERAFRKALAGRRAPILIDVKRTRTVPTPVYDFRSRRASLVLSRIEQE